MFTIFKLVGDVYMSVLLPTYLPSLFQDHLFSVVEFESGLIEHGPFSTSNPSIDELPGPPFIQIDSGAF
jgi:hypothetical protein